MGALHQRYKGDNEWYTVRNGVPVDTRAPVNLQRLPQRVSRDMGVLESIVARLPGAVIAVDADLRVRSLSPGAQDVLGVSASDAEGRLCYEIMSAVESDTGRPCHEQCPLSRPNARPGWAFNRMIDARWSSENRTRLDCFLLKSRVSPTQTGQLCFLGPYTASSIEANVRGLQIIEAVNPAVSDLTDIEDVADVSLKAILSATSSDVATLLFLDDETRQPPGRRLISVARWPSSSSNSLSAVCAVSASGPTFCAA